MRLFLFNIGLLFITLGCAPKALVVETLTYNNSTVDIFFPGDTLYYDNKRLCSKSIFKDTCICKYSRLGKYIFIQDSTKTQTLKLK